MARTDTRALDALRRAECGDGSRLKRRRASARKTGRRAAMPRSIRERRGVQLLGDDVQRADPRRHNRARRRRGAHRNPARTVGGGRRGERRPRDPGAVLRRRRRARVRRERVQHGVRHADGRLRRSQALTRNIAHVAATALAAGVAGTPASTSRPWLRQSNSASKLTLFHTANGTPLYAPFHLSQTIPAMALAHLTIAGLVEFGLHCGRDRFISNGRTSHCSPQPPRRRGHRRGDRRRPSVSWRWGF